MEQIEIIFVLLFFASVLSFMAHYLKIAHEILLVIGGLFIGFTPGLPLVRLDPNIVFLIFLPPLLSYAAYYFSWREFKIHIWSIGLLAVGAVLFTMITVAFTLKLIIPEVPWAVAFLFGAVVSPPDASAVTAIVKHLKVSERLLTILEGESLINDATALVAFKFALAAILTGVFSIWEASTKFFIVSAGGMAIGLLLGYINVYIRRKFLDTSFDMTLALLTPFFAYIIAEKFHFSGVIGTVTFTLYISRWNPRISTPASRRKAAAIWEMMIFVINSLAFILIGLQLPAVAHTIWSYSIQTILLLSLSIVGVVVIARFVIIFFGAYLPFLVPIIRKKVEKPIIPELIITSWAGMRGIVSLAAAMAIPIYLDEKTGEVFPFRDLIIFLTYIVVLFTLVVPGFTLPAIIKKLNIGSAGTHEQESKDARMACAEAAIIFLKKFSTNKSIRKEYLDVIEQEYMNRIYRLSEKAIKEDALKQLKMENDVRKLKIDLIQEERKILISLRNKELIHDSVMLSIQAELDSRELGLKTDLN
jgi:CPA1 family monovalent cation:H+ antiporter